ncbi:hypothetical protein BDV24DRAFT_173063 [Aspergillus arachidicola]|uniref:Cyanovirin-N domain-containing protein n=1 Tax=Aspergillus arachidicola TaxID=656916 RepID=A0A5N6XQA0_9EURO|nr:hypothetical protein BDV24DRAFT_173063 [Aspergillus arachidicola]
MRLQAFIFVLLGLGKSYAAHFSKTCSSFELEGSMLFAKCQESPDKERHTTVDLNKCLGHKEGALVRGGKGVIAPSSPLNLGSTSMQLFLSILANCSNLLRASWDSILQLCPNAIDNIA